jgi:hypothetical protein
MWDFFLGDRRGDLTEILKNKEEDNWHLSFVSIMELYGRTMISSVLTSTKLKMTSV